MKPSEYEVGKKDSVGNIVKSILAKGEMAAIYTTESNELRWEYNDDGTLPAKVRPAVSRFDKLKAQVKTSALPPPQKDAAYVLLGQCLFQAFNAGDPNTNQENFQSIEEFLTLNAPRPAPQPRWFNRLLARLSWPMRVAAIAIAVVAGCAAWALIDAWRSSQLPLLQSTFCDPKLGADELVVMTHGFTGSKDAMYGVIQAVHQRRPNADILFFSYPASTWANTDPFVLADQLEKAIADADKAHHYKKIILSGHSMGASLVRKAYVYACGCVDDLPLGGPGTTTREPSEWCKKVDRMVLLAGMNRGWNPDVRPADMSWFASCRNYLALRVARFTGTAGFIRSFERGEPFVANLRLQWLDAMRKASSGHSGLRRPVVVQLLGDKDDVVSKDDCRDVNVARDFIWVGVNNSDHHSILQVGRWRWIGAKTPHPKRIRRRRRHSGIEARQSDSGYGDGSGRDDGRVRIAWNPRHGRMDVAIQKAAGG